MTAVKILTKNFAIVLKSEHILFLHDTPPQNCINLETGHMNGGLTTY